VKLLTAPEEPKFWQTKQKLFLAGGISGTTNWQRTAISKLKDLDITIFNPRRTGKLDRKDMKVSGEQIAWERKYLLESTHILFWFPDTSICPIALFELGGALDRTQGCGGFTPIHKIFVGAAPKYDRIVDLKLQIPLILKRYRWPEEIPVHESFKDLIAAVRKDIDRPPIKFEMEAVAPEGAAMLYNQNRKIRYSRRNLP
jgi:hypothetical protein